MFAPSDYRHNCFLTAITVITVFCLLLWLCRKVDESGKVRKKLTKKLFLEGEVHGQERQ